MLEITKAAETESDQPYDVFKSAFLSSLSDAGKRTQTAVGPLSHLSDEAQDHFLS